MTGLSINITVALERMNNFQIHASSVITNCFPETNIPKVNRNRLYHRKQNFKVQKKVERPLNVSKGYIKYAFKVLYKISLIKLFNFNLDEHSKYINYEKKTSIPERCSIYRVYSILDPDDDDILH